MRIIPVYISVIIILFLITSASASVTELTITPANPLVGDTINIKGKANPNEPLDISVNFEKNENVATGNRDYKYVLDFENPRKSDFSVTAINVENLNVGVKILLWWTKSAAADGNNLAKISQSNVPAGTYHIKIDGTASEGQSSVRLKIKASSILTAGSDGYFSYSYSSKGLPAGTYTLNIGDRERSINLGERNSLDTAAITDAKAASSSQKVQTPPEVVTSPVETIEVISEEVMPSADETSPIETPFLAPEDIAPVSSTDQTVSTETPIQRFFSIMRSALQSLF